MRTLLTALLLASCTLAQAAIQTEEIHYQAPDGTPLVGYHAWDDEFEGTRPAVLVVHEWWGLNDYARRRARDLAELGYSAMAIDMYGAGRNTEHPADAKAFMQAALADADAARGRFVAALELLKSRPQSDRRLSAAIGYCFGGKVVLDMARQGVDLHGVVSFHGALATSTRASRDSLLAAVMVAHGADDSFVPAADIAAFKQEMLQADAEWQFISYPGAHHGFTNPDADRMAAASGLDIAYDAEADRQSWADMEQFLAVLFATEP